jgi:pimeloyl-ACP methyl ester carboxylesterase
MPRVVVRGWAAVAAVLGVLAATGTASAQRLPEPADKFVTVNGLKLHYVEWGDAKNPPLILIHGISRFARTFDHLVPSFVDRYRVIAYDLRGHGDSGWDPQARYLVEDHVGDLEGLVKTLGLRGIVVWGNSTGGRVAQVFTALHPELVTHLVSEDVGPERPRSIADGFAKRVAAEQHGWASEDELVATLRKSNREMSETAARTWVRHAAKAREDGRIVWKRDPNLVKGFVETELWRFVGTISRPALYVIGGRSAIVPPETQLQLQNRLPKVRVVSMPGLGHYPSDEKPAEFVALVNEFLKMQ